MREVLLAYGPTIAAWAAVAFRLPALRRRPHDQILRSYSLAILFLALSLSLLLGPVYLAADRIAGVPNLARLLAHAAMIICCFFVLEFLLHLNYSGEEARSRSSRTRWAALGTISLLGVLFAAADLSEEALDFTTRYADAPFVAEYRVVLLAYIGFTLVNIVRLSWRYGRVSVGRPALQLGLRLVAFGSVFGLVYVANGVAYLGYRRFAVTYPLADVQAISDVLVAACVALVVIGSTMPAWGPRVGIPHLYQWLATYRAYRRLFPLWRDLCRALPEIPLFPVTSPLVDTLDLRGLRFRLYRRVVEIRDGELALRQYFDPRLEDAAQRLCHERGLGNEEARALAEACQVWLALRSVEAGTTTTSRQINSFSEGGSDVQSEAAFLAKVARHYCRPALLQQVVARLNAESTTTAPISGGSAP